MLTCFVIPNSRLTFWFIALWVLSIQTYPYEALIHILYLIMLLVLALCFTCVHYFIYPIYLCVFWAEFSFFQKIISRYFHPLSFGGEFSFIPPSTMGGWVTILQHHHVQSNISNPCKTALLDVKFVLKITSVSAADLSKLRLFLLGSNVPVNGFQCRRGRMPFTILWPGLKRIWKQPGSHTPLPITILALSLDNKNRHQTRTLLKQRQSKLHILFRCANISNIYFHPW